MLSATGCGCECATAAKGIPPEHLPLIFDRFYKVDASRKAAGGSGLGLSIVRAIVERHGGTVAAHNEGGAVFDVLLPLSTAADPDASGNLISLEFQLV
jgi:signal transduction histidine kinase